jgi:hypothetical protein
MPPEHFFTGTTGAERELRLFYEHTAFDTYDTDDGPYDNPTSTEITGTLDGVPVAIQTVTAQSGGGVTVVTDVGTFSAVPGDSDESHSEVLRHHLEWRPIGGYEVAVVDKGQVPNGARYTVTITNGRLTERADFIVSAQVMRTLAGGASEPTDGQVARQIACEVRGDEWPEIKERVTKPTTLLFQAHSG